MTQPDTKLAPHPLEAQMRDPKVTLQAALELALSKAVDTGDAIVNEQTGFGQAEISQVMVNLQQAAFWYQHLMGMLRVLQQRGPGIVVAQNVPNVPPGLEL